MPTPTPRIVAIIPARMGSSRFPGKPLAPILGLPMLEHVYRRTAMAKGLGAVYVATCDPEIANAVRRFGSEAIMTSPRHERASDRVAEAAQKLAADIVLMVQGDEPMTTPAMIEQALAPMLADSAIHCVNLVKRITAPEDYRDPNTIKVIMNQRWEALFFSRQPVPSAHIVGFEQIPVFKQVCIIPFRRAMLETYVRLTPTPLEKAESIDMLRLLEHGYPVHLAETDQDTHAVDTPADLTRLEALMRDDPVVSLYL